MSSEDKLSVMCMLICCFLSGCNIGSLTVIDAVKHPNVGFLVLWTSVTFTGCAMGNLFIRCFIRELSPMHMLLPVSTNAFTLWLWSNLIFKCGLLG